MFSSIVHSQFAFLVEEFGFSSVPTDEKSGQFELGDIFVRIFHTSVDEVSMRVGLLSLGLENGFSAGLIVALDDPKVGFALRDRTAFNPEQMKLAVRELAELLRSHGHRILQGDTAVFQEMRGVLDHYWRLRNDIQVRQRAEAAFSAGKFDDALELYRQLEDRAKPLDIKRMEICQRRR